MIALYELCYTDIPTKIMFLPSAPNLYTQYAMVVKGQNFPFHQEKGQMKHTDVADLKQI